MEDKELEELLKESVNKVKMKDFSERWNEMKDRMPKRKKRFSYKIFLALASSICLVILAVTLPLALKPKERYFTGNELSYLSVTEDRFFSEMNSAGFETKAFRELKIDKFFIALTEDETLRGGRVAFENLAGDETYIFTITVLSSAIVFDEADFRDLTFEMAIGDAEIHFKTTQTDLYESEVYVRYRSDSYVISYTSLEDDLEQFLAKLFTE